jgi:hypothetical protein
MAVKNLLSNIMNNKNLAAKIDFKSSVKIGLTKPRT